MPPKTQEIKNKTQICNGIFGKTRTVHFIGIGGIGMSGIAKIVLNMGFVVSGSDLRGSKITDELTAQGCRIFIGHKASNIKNVDVVVTSSAISPVNEELISAREKGITVIHRSEMLAELMRLKFGIAVAGTHGKTTTTSFCASVCIEGGLNPTSVIGGNFLKINSNSTLGSGKMLICEADESDGSFLRLNPSISIVTNIDNDHMDYYQTEENLLHHFREFLNKTPFYGKNILCFEDQRIREMARNIDKPFLSYGLSSDCDLWADDIVFAKGKMKYSVYYHKKKLGNFNLSVLGKHNVLNSLAAIAVGLECDIPVPALKKGISSFSGVARRMYKLGTYQDYTVIDDYGHHPTEISATLSAVRLLSDELIVVFQPHRYSRTMNLYREFADSLRPADVLYLMDIYAAGENPINGVSSGLILAEIEKKRKKQVQLIDDKNVLLENIKASIKKRKKKGIILFLGAGDVYKLGQELAGDSGK